MIILYSYLSFFEFLASAKLFLLPALFNHISVVTEKPDFFNFLIQSCFPLLLSVMYENKFLCFVYSVFNEHCRLIPQAKLNFH